MWISLMFRSSLLWADPMLTRYCVSSRVSEWSPNSKSSQQAGRPTPTSSTSCEKAPRLWSLLANALCETQPVTRVDRSPRNFLQNWSSQQHRLGQYLISHKSCWTVSHHSGLIAVSSHAISNHLAATRIFATFYVLQPPSCMLHSSSSWFVWELHCFIASKQNVSHVETLLRTTLIVETFLWVQLHINSVELFLVFWFLHYLKWNLRSIRWHLDNCKISQMVFRDRRWTSN